MNYSPNQGASSNGRHSSRVPSNGHDSPVSNGQSSPVSNHQNGGHSNGLYGNIKKDRHTGTSLIELSTRPWLYFLSHKYQSNITQLSDIPIEEFQLYVDRKIKWVWLMGLWELGDYGLHHDRTDPGLLKDYKVNLPDYNLDDVIGSPYAITQYHCNPQLGLDDDIRSLKQKLNSMGLLLMVDFVPNHSAVDAPTVKSNPEFYVRSPPNQPVDTSKFTSGGIAYGGSGAYTWTDTLQFNYWDPTFRKARVQELLHVASLSDGMRCDMAYLLLNENIEANWGQPLAAWGYKKPSTEWWTGAILTVKAQYPHVIFAAEVYSPWETNLQQCGFDYTYDKTLYDRLGEGNLDEIRNWLSSHSEEYLKHSVHFVSNHDEPRAAQFFGSTWRANAAAFIAYTIPGMRLYWMWENRGYNNKLDVHLRREQSESNRNETVQFYKTLWNITNDDVFDKGQWKYLQVIGSNDGWRLVAYRWHYLNKKRLVVVNYSDTQGSGNIVLSNAEAVGGNDTIPVRDLITDITYQRSAASLRSSGLSVVIPSWWAQIFEY